MNVQVFCVKCDRSCRVLPEHVGRRVRCPGCQVIFKAEQPPLADSSAKDAVEVFCSKCDAAGRVTADLLGRRVRCVRCHEIFQAEDVPVAALDDEAGVEPAASPSAADSARSASDSTLRKIPTPSIPPPPPVPVPRIDKPKPAIDERLLDDDDGRDRDRARSRNDKDGDDEDAIGARPAKRRRDENDEDFDDEDSDRGRASKRSGRDAAKPKPRKDEPLLEVGRLENPFVDSSTLASVEVDQSVFEFDWGDESEPDDEERERPSKKRQEDSRRRDDRDRSREKRDEDRSPRPKKKDNADTEYAWDDKKSPPDDLPSESKIAKSKKSVPTPEPTADESTPFAFGDGRGDEKPRSRDRKGSPDEDDAESERKKKLPPKKPVGSQDDADFLGLSNFDDPAPVDDPKSAARMKSQRDCFHVRQTGFWPETRLYRVFVENGELLFVTAAKANDIPDMQEALQADSLDEFDKRIRNKVKALDELPVDDLLDKDDDSFVWSAQKITEAVIDPLNPKTPAPKVPGGSRRSAVLVLTHKSKGTVTFDFPADSDVESALRLLRDLLDDILEINVRWDKLSKRFVKQ